MASPMAMAMAMAMQSLHFRLACVHTKMHKGVRQGHAFFNAMPPSWHQRR